MKSSTLTSSGSAGLAPYRWNSFSVAPGAAFGPLSVSFTPTNFQCLADEGGGSYPNFKYRFSVAGVQPAWIQPGAGIVITSASVTVNGTSYAVNGSYVIKNVDPNGTYFEVDAPRPHGSRDGAAMTQAVAQTALDTSGPYPNVALVIQCQKAMLSASVAGVVIAPSVDYSGNAPYQVTIAAAGAEYEITSPPGCKFDLADWQAKQSGAGAQLAVRFL